MDVISMSKRLKTERENKGITIKDLAKKMFVSQQAIYKWEQGKGVPSVDNLIWLCDFYGVTADYLLGRS